MTSLAEMLDPGPPFEWSGRFRRPDLPAAEPSLPGILTIDQADGVSLRLFGTYSDTHPFGSLFDQPRPEWTILGEVEKGDAVTVVGARHVGGREQHPGALELHLRASAALIGEQHVRDPTSAQFDRVEVGYDELPLWTGHPRGWPPSGWQNVRGVRNVARLRGGAAASETHEPSEIAIELGYYERAALTASIRGYGRIDLTLRGVVRPRPAGGAELAEEGGLLIAPRRPVSLRDVDDEIRVPFDRLLALAFDRSVVRRHLRIRMRQGPARRGRRGSPPDRWLYVLTGREAVRASASPRPGPLAVHATAENFQPLLSAWIALHRKQRRALNYFFETAFGGERFVDRGLLTAIQAIEGYHRADSPVPARAQRAFERDRQRARDLVDEAGIQQRVIAGSYGYEPTLIERISDLVGRQVPAPSGTRRQRAERNRFAGRVAELRNGLAHLLERFDDFSVIEMYEYRQRGCLVARRT